MSKTVTLTEHRPADGMLTMRVKNTTYNVNIFFNPNATSTLDTMSLLAERIEQPGAQTPLPDYAIEIVRGVAEHIAAIDAMLDEHSTGWKVKRMGVVDRNILRIAAWEIMFNDDVPNMVAIDEALSLAKTLCDDDSPAFIHGLLSAVSADAEATEVAEQPTEPSAE